MTALSPVTRPIPPAPLTASRRALGLQPAYHPGGLPPRELMQRLAEHLGLVPVAPRRARLGAVEELVGQRNYAVALPSLDLPGISPLPGRFPTFPSLVVDLREPLLRVLTHPPISARQKAEYQLLAQLVELVEQKR